MTSTSAMDIIKTDSRGRVRTPVRRREQLLHEFAQSGVSARKFAELAGIHYQTFAGWLQRQRKKGAVAPNPKGAKTSPDRMQWLEAVIENPQGAKDSNPASMVRLRLTAGVTLEYECSSQIPLIVELLRSLSKETPVC